MKKSNCIRSHYNPESIHLVFLFWWIPFWVPMASQLNVCHNSLWLRRKTSLNCEFAHALLQCNGMNTFNRIVIPLNYSDFDTDLPQIKLMAWVMSTIKKITAFSSRGVLSYSVQLSVKWRKKIKHGNRITILKLLPSKLSYACHMTMMHGHLLFSLPG